jgi:hypothetical protein
MSTQTSLPRRMRLQLPENGYESPGPRDGILFGNGIKEDGERKKMVLLVVQMRHPWKLQPRYWRNIQTV